MVDYIKIKKKTLCRCAMLTKDEKAVLVDCLVALAEGAPMPEEVPTAALMLYEFMRDEITRGRRKEQPCEVTDSEEYEEGLAEDANNSDFSINKKNKRKQTKKETNKTNKKEKEKEKERRKEAKEVDIKKDIKKEINKERKKENKKIKNKKTSSSSSAHTRGEAEEEREEEEEVSKEILEIRATPLEQRRQTFYQQIMAPENVERYGQDKLTKFYSYYSPELKDGLMLFEKLKYIPGKGRQGTFDIPRRLVLFHA